MIFKIARIAFLLSKYRVLDVLVSSQNRFLLSFFYKLFIVFLYPVNIFRINKIFGDQNLLELLKQLGPIYIKFGQMLSTRPDLIGEPLSSSLRVLQDNLAPFSSEVAKKMIEDELRGSLQNIFSQIDEKPIASASIAQVYKATLACGDVVAAKVLRPNVHKDYKDNIDVLHFLAKLLSTLSSDLKKFRLIEVLKVFEDSMNLELDLRIEASSCCELSGNMAGDPNICVPKVYWALTTKSVLVTQWIDGISVYDTKSMIDQGIDVTALSKKVAVMFFNQTYRDGFFHADLHPGNIFVTLSGDIAMVDFGIMGRLSDKDRFSVAQILHAFLQRNYMQVAKVHLNAGYIPRETDLHLFAQYCRAVCEPIVGLPLKDVSISNILNQMFEVINIFGLQIQPQLVLLQKSMVIIEGIGKALNPNINMWELAYPWMEDWAIKNISFEATLFAKVKSFISNELLNFKR